MKTKQFHLFPPDGIFELMSYRLTNVNVDPLIWCEMKVEESSATRIEYVIKITSQFKEKHTANNIVIKIPVRSDVISPEIKCEAGSHNILSGVRIDDLDHKNHFLEEERSVQE